MTVAVIPSGGVHDHNLIFTGVSDQPKSIDDQVIEANVRFKEAASSQPLVLALEQLRSVYDECSADNWDGYGALPVSAEAAFEATLFLELLSDSHLPMPDISPEVDGGIEFEWYMQSDYIFTVSFNGKKILGYSGMFGKGNTNYGTEKINTKIPDIIRWNISNFIQK